MSYVPFECRQMQTKCEKISIIMVAFLVNQGGKKCLHTLNSTVFKCKMLVLFLLRDRVSQMSLPRGLIRLTSHPRDNV